MGGDDPICQGRRQVRTEGGGIVDHPWCKCSGGISAGKGIGREPVEGVVVTGSVGGKGRRSTRL